MQAYYKISLKFAEHVEMLVPEDSPKLLKVLREELSMSILPTQKTIHTLLHNMGADQRKFNSSYIRAVVPQEMQKNHNENLNDIKLNNEEDETSTSIINKLKSVFQSKKKEPIITEKRNKNTLNLSSFAPLLLVFLSGAYFTAQNNALENKVRLIKTQSSIQTKNSLLASNTQKVFDAMGKSGELNSATISDQQIELKGLVWGIEPLKNKLSSLYPNGEFNIKPLKNFMTEFSFKSTL